MLYLGVSDGRPAQINILEALTRKFRLHPDLSLPLLAEQCPFNFTGADFYALCADAMLKAMSRKAMELEAKLGKNFNMNHISHLVLIYNSLCSGNEQHKGAFTFATRYTSVLSCRDGVIGRRDCACVPTRL
jgi:SpoVK/Ycf46/Vps4 family AAA+-type ATPase